MAETPEQNLQSKKGPDLNLLLGLGIAFVMLSKVSFIFSFIGALFLIAWGWIMYDTFNKKKEIDLKAYGQKKLN